MSRGKSVDRSGCSLVVEVILIAVSPCLIEVPLADLWGHEIRDVASVCAYRKRYAVGDLAWVCEQLHSVPCGISGAAPFRVN